MKLKEVAYRFAVVSSCQNARHRVLPETVSSEESIFDIAMIQYQSFSLTARPYICVLTQVSTLTWLL